MSNPVVGSVSYRAVKEPNKPEYWVAEINGKVVARAMSEQGVRSLVMTIINKSKKGQENV